MTHSIFLFARMAFAAAFGLVTRQTRRLVMRTAINCIAALICAVAVAPVRAAEANTATRHPSEWISRSR